MKNDNITDKNTKKRPDTATAGDQTQPDMDSLLQMALKKRGDTAVHITVTNNDPTTLRELLNRGLRVFNQSDADGATALHRAAEIGSQECAKVLLEFNADIDALNFMGQTAFHVAAEKQDYEFGKYLIKFRARKNCRSGCKKCRFFIKQIEKYDKSTKEREEHEKQTKQEEQKVQKQEKQDQKLVDDMSQLNLLDEIERCRKELGGPFFNKKENQLLKEQQEKYREAENLRTQKNGIKQMTNVAAQEIMVNLETPVVVEQIRPRRHHQQNSQRNIISSDNYTREQVQPSTVNRQDERNYTSFNQGRQSHQAQQQQQYQANVQNERELIRSRQVDNQKKESITNTSQSQNEPQYQLDNDTSERQNPPLGQDSFQFNSQRQIGKKQKRKKRVDEEEEKKTARSSLTQTTDPDSDNYQ